jgi:hypothetical protein
VVSPGIRVMFSGRNLGLLREKKNFLQGKPGGSPGESEWFSGRNLIFPRRNRIFSGRFRGMSIHDTIRE